MADVKIYHNPRCSKSRQALALLAEKGIKPEIVLYLETPPSVDELRALLRKLGMGAKDLLRKGEDDYKSHIAPLGEIPEEQLISLMSHYPRVIERPIISTADQAVLGRPPETVLSLF